MPVRGKIQYKERAQQLTDYSGLEYPNGITPTDIDGLIEINDKAFIILELKYDGARLKFGVRLAIERVCARLVNDGANVLFMVADHYHDNPKEEINAARAIIREAYFNGDQIEPQKGVTVKYLVDRFYKKYINETFELEKCETTENYEWLKQYAKTCHELYGDELPEFLK